MKVKPSIALEGTMSGAINRQRFANYVATLTGYQTLHSYLRHDANCEVLPTTCTCGLQKLLTQGIK